MSINSEQGSSLAEADCELYPAFCRAEAREWLEKLEAQLFWQSETISIYGKTVAVPRLTAFYGDDGLEYTYSKVSHRAQPWHPILSRIRSRLESRLMASFNVVLANLYRNGSDYMGWHSDDEIELGVEPIIASVSLGAVRPFYLRHKTAQRPPCRLELESGSLLIMKGSCQRMWQHSLPKRKKITEPRINLTFRYIQP